MLRQNANKLVLCCLLAVVLAVSVVLPSVTSNSNVAIADSSTTAYYSGNYYNSIDTSLRGDDFRDKLANLITTTHTTYTSYAGLEMPTKLPTQCRTRVAILHGFTPERK